MLFLKSLSKNIVKYCRKDKSDRERRSGSPTYKYTSNPKLYFAPPLPTHTLVQCAYGHVVITPLYRSLEADLTAYFNKLQLRQLRAESQQSKQRLSESKQRLSNG